MNSCRIFLFTISFFLLCISVLSGNGSAQIDPEDADYFVHVFTANGTFNAAKGLGEVEVLVVGGGGGGASATALNSGGGGGAGAVIYRESFSVSGAVSVIIGSGGAGGSSANGAKGETSSFGNLFAEGGGGGAWHNSLAAMDGASGGGGAGMAQLEAEDGAGGKGSTGNNGGKGRGSFNSSGGGGGGGQDEAGENASAGKGGKGGTGTYMEGFAAFGENGYFAGGGGGAGSELPGIGGLGGGAAAGNDALANTGGGGGGSSDGIKGGDGGSGIVIVRYKAITYIEIETEDISFTFADDIKNPGAWMENSQSNSEATLKWSAFNIQDKTFRIDVKISDGKIPDGMKIELNCDKKETGIILNTENYQTLLNDLANQIDSSKLTYKITIDEADKLSAGESKLNIEYTIRENY